MSSAIAAIFWFSVAALAYTPVGYMLCLRILSRLAGRPISRTPIRPSVSLIIPVHNGASLIRGKIENCRHLDYPQHLLEVIVVDDCSTDGTAALAADATVISLDERKGKPVGLNRGLGAATGEIIGFTDVGVMLEPDALSTAIESFADPTVGCVSSEDVVLAKGGVGEGEGFYTRIDTAIRRLESAISSIAGVSGSFYLVRRELCPPFPLDAATDMFSGLYCVDCGYRAVVEQRSKVRIQAQADPAREFDRKVRTMVTGLRALGAFPRLLNPFYAGIYSWFLTSHKIVRYLMPVFAVTALFSSAYLGPASLFFRCCFAAGMAALCIGYAQILLQSYALMNRLPGTFGFLCTSLVAAGAGWVRFLSGERYETWQPTERSAV